MRVVNRALQHADIREITVALGIVEPVADDEAVGDAKAEVIAGHLDLPRLALDEQAADSHAGGPPSSQVAEDVLQGHPGVNDVFHDQDVLVGYRLVEVLENPNDAAALGAGPI